MSQATDKPHQPKQVSKQASKQAGNQPSKQLTIFVSAVCGSIRIIFMLKVLCSQEYGKPRDSLYSVKLLMEG
jgi:hypothetical protein